MGQSVYWLDSEDLRFPPIEYALDDPNGLIAAGGDLSPQRLLEAYSQGIFPWYNENDPILWWNPDPRSVVFPAEYKPSTSLKKLIKKQTYHTKINSDFDKVIHACAAPRKDSDGTWINEDMISAYKTLHKMGYAHSFETWREDTLVGGLYGIAIGKAFFGESMFSTESNTSKIAFNLLCETLSAHDFKVIDCQIHNPHLARLGAKEIKRQAFLDILEEAVFEGAHK